VPIAAASCAIAVQFVPVTPTSVSQTRIVERDHGGLRSVSEGGNHLKRAVDDDDYGRRRVGSRWQADMRLAMSSAA